MNIHCSICAELEGVRPNRLSPILDGATNAILLESENFAVIPSVGSLVVGHCLVVTKQHSSNVMYGLSSSCYVELRNGLMILLSRLAANDGSSQLFCFEHGKRHVADDDILCSTAHGHLHVMPSASVQASDVFDKLGVTRLHDVNHQSFIQEVQRLENYFAAFVWQGYDDRRSSGATVDATGFPSQYLRRVIGELLGTEEWDWKRFPRFEVVRETINKLSATLRTDRAALN